MSQKKDSESLGENVKDLTEERKSAKKHLNEEKKEFEKHEKMSEEEILQQKESKKQEQENINEQKLETENLKSSEQKSEEKISNEDFMSFYEINFFLKFFTQNQRIDGFRPGKIPIPIIQMKNPWLMDHIFEMKCSQKSNELKEKNLYATIEKIIAEESGFRIFYHFHDLKNTNK
jgi:hypothetical protein